MEAIYSKLLLFGEHTVVKGSQALAIPFEEFSGQWRFAKSAQKQARLQQDLRAFQAYLAGLKPLGHHAELNTEAFLHDLQNGLYFDANIPVGYGLGSSGALCAAVYQRYARQPVDPMATDSFPALKKVLARMESFFHGSSSGTDPLICYLGHPVIIQADGKIERIELPAPSAEPAAQLFLLDTGISRQTGPLVELFLEKCEDTTYEKRVISELIPANEAAIANYLRNNWRELFFDIHQISHFQFKYMSEMIPSELRMLWLDGLSSDYYKLKICGAGGGGFLLGITTDYYELVEKVNGEFPGHEVLSIG